MNWNVLHEHFINRLTSYFARTYSVDLSAQSITERLLPSNNSKGIFEREKAEEAEAAYHNAMRELALRYTDVLDQIFIQLGGRSFQEKAFWELQQRCCSAVWNTYKTNRSMFSKRISFIFIVTSAAVTQIGHRRAGV